MQSSSDTMSVMLDLKDFFLESLGERIEKLTAALEEEVTPGSDVEARIRHIAHAIRGAGGTYGFPELSQVAETVDLAPPEELISRARRLVTELVRVTRSGAQAQTRVLLVEGDDDVACTVLSGLGSPTRSVRRVRDAAEAVEVLYKESFQLIVVDLDLPDRAGQGLLLRLADQYRTAAVPVIALAGEATEELQVECFRMGALHLFPKSVSNDVLSAAAGAAIERAEHSRRVSTLDPLTGLPNRAGFHATLQHAVSICSRSEEPMSVALLDLDRFKAINDTHGHLVGDEVLTRVAGVLKRRTRKSDYVARWGGEEFVALFYGSRPGGAALALERIREHVKQEVFATRDGTTFHVSFSAGVAEVLPEVSAEESISEADRLLYRAKAAGRDRVVTPDCRVEEARANVLLVEDDELVAAAVRRTLGRQGYDVIHRDSSETALEAVEELELALGILDVNMPGMNGFELLTRLRRIPRLKDTPLIMLTGRGAERDVVRGFELGADDYVIKPFSPQALAARVHRMIRRS